MDSPAARAAGIDRCCGRVTQTGVVIEQIQSASNVNRCQLRRVAEQPHRRIRLLGKRARRVQMQGSGHTSFIDEDNVPRPQRVPDVAGTGHPVLVEELVHVLGSQPELGAQDLSCLRGGERVDERALSCVERDAGS